VLTADGDHIEDSDETTGGDQATDGQGLPLYHDLPPVPRQARGLESVETAPTPGGSTGEAREPVMNPITFTKAPEIQLDPASMSGGSISWKEQAVLIRG